MQNLGCPVVRDAKSGGRATAITTRRILMIYGPLNRKFFVDNARLFFFRKKNFFRGEKFIFSCFLTPFRAKKWLRPTALQGGWGRMNGAWFASSVKKLGGVPRRFFEKFLITSENSRKNPLWWRKIRFSSFDEFWPKRPKRIVFASSIGFSWSLNSFLQEISRFHLIWRPDGGMGFAPPRGEKYDFHHLTNYDQNG